MDYDDVSMTMFLEEKYMLILEANAIHYGFNCINSYFETLVRYMTIEDLELENDNYHNEELEIFCLKHKKEYYEEFDEKLEKFYKNDADKKILRQAHFYYTSRENEVNTYKQIHNKKRMDNYSNAMDTVEKLFKNIKLDEDTKEFIITTIDSAVNKQKTSKQDVRNEYSRKIDKELNKLKISEYKKNQILDTFRNSLPN